MRTDPNLPIYPKKSVRFAYVTSPIKAGMGEHILEMYEGASVFACQKTCYPRVNQMIRNDNPLTAELHRQIMNVIHHTVTAIPVGEGWSWDEYKTIKNALVVIKQSNWHEPTKDDFVVTAHGLLNLLNTAVSVWK